MPATLLNAIQHRFACHRFVADAPLTADDLALLLQAGQLAPSAFGLEPWRFIVVTTAPQRAAVVHACFDQPTASTAAAFIVIATPVATLDPDSDYVAARFQAEARGGDTATIYAAYRAHYHPTTIAGWAQGQGNFAAAHMLLQATHMGLGSCPIGGFDAAALTRALRLSEDELPTLVIALGQCAETAPTRQRKPVNGVA